VTPSPSASLTKPSFPPSIITTPNEYHETTAQAKQLQKVPNNMPYFKTAQEWLDQSKLLLEARPATVCLFPDSLSLSLSNFPLDGRLADSLVGTDKDHN
jgi:hypothetical protein